MIKWISQTASDIVGWGILLCVLLLCTNAGQLILRFFIATAITGVGIGVYLVLT